MSLISSLTTTLTTASTALLSRLSSTSSSIDFFTLGIDIGTTSIKIVIVHSRSSSSSSHFSSPSTPSSSLSNTAASTTPFSLDGYTHSVLSFAEKEHQAACTPSPLYSPPPLFSPSSSCSSSSPPTSPASFPQAFPAQTGGEDEQRVDSLLLCVQQCLDLLPDADKSRVQYVGVTGAMHGVVLWNERLVAPYITALLGSHNEARSSWPECCHSPLFTWRDRRASPSLVQSLNATSAVSAPSRPASQGLLCFPGYGTVTLAHLAQHFPAYLSRWTRSGTIGDYIVWLLMNVRDQTSSFPTKYPCYMHPTNAASFGCFDVEKGQWQNDTLSMHRVPLALLPVVLDAKTSPLFAVSPLISNLLRLHCKAEVGLAIGDAAAVIYATQPKPNEMVVNVGTAAQLSLLFDATEHTGESMESDESDAWTRVDQSVSEVSFSYNIADDQNQPEEEEYCPPQPPLRAHSSISSAAITRPFSEYRPYVKNARLLVVASMAGGHILEALAACLLKIHQRVRDRAKQLNPNEEFEDDCDLAYFYELLLHEGEESAALHPSSLREEESERSSATMRALEELFICPHSAAETEAIFLQAMKSMTVGVLCHNLCKLLMRTLYQSLYKTSGSRERRRLAQVTHLVGVGGAIRRNPILRHEAEQRFQMNLELREPILITNPGSDSTHIHSKRHVIPRENSMVTKFLSSSNNSSESDSEHERQAEQNQYSPDAAYGAAMLGIEKLAEANRRELIAQSSSGLMNLFR